ncbi:MAG: fasciclin domain-containing protein [Cetobacterium sp.]
MTYVGPYSEATLMYEPSEPDHVVEVATPGTILDFVEKNSPNFLFLIKRANLLNLYNSSQQKHTLFLPSSSCIIPNKYIDPNTAFKICKFSTTPGNITTTMLSSSPNFVLYSLLPNENLNIQNTRSEVPLGRAQSAVTIQNKVLLHGDIMCTNGIIHFIDGLLNPDF